MLKWTTLLAAVAAAATAQPPSVTVYSEFARIESNGNVSAPETPREILSPALARNAFTSFQIVIQAPARMPYRVWIGQNPTDAVKVTLYRENGNKLEPVSEPVEGDSTQVLWMDLWTGGRATVQRVKVEPQLGINNDWVIYPIEARVMDARVPEGAWPTGTAVPVEVMRNYLCNGPKPPAAPAGPVSVESLRFRNSQQDLALARQAPKADLQKLFGACDAPASPDPEWYLRIRDYLFRQR